MLHDSESIAHFKSSNVLVWMLMALQGGFLNMAGFMSCGRFVSHVTGYGTMIAFEVGEHSIAQALSLAVVPAFFLLGSMLSGLLIDLRLRLHKRPRYYIAFGVIFLLIALILFSGEAGFFGPFGEGLKLQRDYLLLLVLAFVCGVQNGTVTTVSRSVIRTTHLSGITTDLGIGIVRILNRRKLKGEIPDEGKANFMRVGIIGFFIIGSYLGYRSFKAFGFLAFAGPLLTSGLLFCLMIYFQFLNRRRSKQ
jgi:uncharacterized membrane protein YoaK (UPF0700 family)